MIFCFLLTPSISSEALCSPSTPSFSLVSSPPFPFPTSRLLYSPPSPPLSSPLLSLLFSLLLSARFSSPQFPISSYLFSCNLDRQTDRQTDRVSGDQGMSKGRVADEMPGLSLRASLFIRLHIHVSYRRTQPRGQCLDSRAPACEETPPVLAGPELLSGASRHSLVWQESRCCRLHSL